MNKNCKRAKSVSVITAIILAMSLQVQWVKASDGQVKRIGESDRYKTAAKIATTNWTTSKEVVLVCGEGYADAISASVLAKTINAPILLTTSETLSLEAKQSLEALKSEKIYVIGGEASIGNKIRNELKTKYHMVELQGKNRYETNLAVANELVKNHKVKADKVMLVGGEGFSDALSVAPIAAAKGQILLLGSNDINTMKSVSDFVKDNSSKVKVVGTKSIINEDMMKMLGTNDRIDGGKDRFDTNLKVLNAFKSELRMDKMFIANATGNGYADSLVASVLAGKSSSPLVLVDTEEANATANAREYIKNNVDKTTSLNVVGGTGVISEETVKSIDNTINWAKPSTETTDESNKSSGGSSGGASTSTNINIPDAKLKETINHALGKDRKADALITRAEMESLKELSSDFLSIIDKPSDITQNGSRGISNLTGLEYAVNLESLDLSENKISDLSPIKNSTKLKWLELDRNYIKDLSPLSKMTVLEHLNIYNNEGIVNLNPISKLKSIKWIDMHHCSRSEAPLNVEVLSNLVNLEYLSFETNKITDLSFVKSLPNLKTLSCNNTFVTDLEPVQDLAIAAFNDWTGERFFNMFGQKLDNPFKIKANANGGEYRFKSPVKNYERYKAHVEKIIEEQQGEEIKVPAVDNSNLDVDYLKFDFDHDTNEVVVKVDRNETGKAREYKIQILLDYGMYSLRENFEIEQDSKEVTKDLDETDFEFSDGAITKYVGNKENVVIPEKIGGKEVASIQNEAFTDCTTLKSLTIPGSVKTIGEDAFYGCTNLESLIISEGVENIENGAFYKCSGLKSVTIPKSVKHIGDHAFYECNSLTLLKLSEGLKELGFGAFLRCKSLTSVEIPASVETINEWAFAECDKLTQIKINEDNKNYSDIDGLLVSKDKTTLIQYIDKYGDNYIVPEGITKLAKGAFNAAKIKSIKLPKSLQVIGFSAFEECHELTSIEIPENVTTIDHFAFAFCDNLKTIEIPGKVTSIGNNVFKDCTNLESVKISESVKSIGENCFKGCAKLKTLTIDNFEGAVSIVPKAIADSVKITYLKQKEDPEITPEDKESISMSEDVKNFYLDLFNKYSKSDKKYTNIVDSMASSYEKLPEDHIFTKGDMKKLKKFYDSEVSVTSELVEPLKYAINLENFDVEFYGKGLDRNIENFDFLKNCKKLKTMYYLNNGLDCIKDKKSELKNINALAELTNLQDLRINMTTLEDSTPINNLKLKTLVLPDNNIKEINSTIEKMQTLERLDVENNKISDISAFKNLVNLRSSYLYNNKLSDISPLSELHKLEALLINGNNIKDITPLKSLNLKRLYINGNPLPENYISTVKDFSKVNTLKVGDITVDDFQWLKTFAIRDEEGVSDLSENNARLYTFSNMPIEIKASATSIKDGVLTIDNPLRGLTNEPVLQDEEDPEYKINEDITFKEDKIEIKMEDPSATSLKVKYQMYTEDPEKIFGEYSQAASIVGTITLNISIEK